MKVSAAYDVLSDEKKRSTYDKYGQNGLDALEKGMDPEEAGFGGFGGFGGGGGASYNNADAFKMFENMFGGSGMGGGGMPDMGDIFGNMGGFGGGGGGGGRQQRRQQQQRKEPPVLKDDPSGVVPLGKAKFPDSKSKHPWLLLFYNKEKFDEDATTQQYVSIAKKISEGVLKKAKGSKNYMTFKVGAVDCSDAVAKKFCKSKLGGDKVPSFATVLNGSVSVITDDDALRNAKQLHDYTTNSLINMDGLVINVNSKAHVQSRLLSTSSTPGHPSISILLLTDKYETSPLYASLAYRHRQDGFSAFGESRGSNVQMGKEYSVKKYPHLIALVNNEEIIKYEGKSFDSENLSKWLNNLSKKYFKSSSSDSRRRSR